MENAFRYYITVLDTASGVYWVKDHILESHQTSYGIYGNGIVNGHTYEIYVKSVDSNGKESEKSNVITLTIGEDFIAKVTGISLQNADAESRETIQNALYNVLFKAEFRPDTNDISGDKTNFGVYGSGSSQKTVNAAWPAKNGGGLKYKIEDKILGSIDIGGGAGCNSYGRFVSKYTYGTVGTATKIISSESNLINMIHQYADPGEWIRMDGNSPHVVVFLGESQDGKGFYYVDYSDNSGKSPQIRVGYYTYHDFWDKYKNNSIYIMDTNSGSYYEGTAKPVSEIRAKNKATKTVLKLACPIEATITLGNEVLDSRNPGRTSFGSVTRNGEEVTFSLDYREDYTFNIIGTGEGSMTLTLDYYNGTRLTDSRTFVEVPITEKTIIQTSGFDTGADFTLFIDKDGNGIEDSAWGAKPNETVSSADKQYDNQEYEAVEGSKNTGNGTGNANSRFSDVPANAYYYDAVQWAVANGITGGTSATTFGPNVTCTRGQIVTFLWHAAGSPKPTSNRNPFTDVKAGSYYYDAVLWAVENNITSGTSATTFGPDQGCTRGQVMTFLYHYEKNPQVNSTKNPFTDVKAQDYFYNAVLWAVGNDITSGTSATTFGPNAMCTRAQIVTFLYRELA